MPGVIAAATGSDWNAGGSIMTFYFPVGLFVAVATILYLLFSRPHKVPGHVSPASTSGPGTASSRAATTGRIRTQTAGSGDGAVSSPEEDRE